jgi:polyhydroxyalkanoate synthesis repressor PhaR
VGGRHAGGPNLIRRYENRKLYDARARRHVTLADIAAMIAAGEDVQVVERASGEDITTTVLAQVIFESIKQRNADVPRQVLARWIRFGRRVGDAPVAGTARPDPARRARDEAERIVSGLVQRGRLTLEEALALRQEIADSIHRFAGEAQRGIEQRLRGLLDSTDDAAVRPALRRLQERLLEAESWIETPRARKGRANPARKRG